MTLKMNDVQFLWSKNVFNLIKAAGVATISWGKYLNDRLCFAWKQHKKVEKYGQQFYPRQRLSSPANIFSSERLPCDCSFLGQLSPLCYDSTWKCCDIDNNLQDSIFTYTSSYFIGRPCFVRLCLGLHCTALTFVDCTLCRI